jgi:hypothetical protein
MQNETDPAKLKGLQRSFRANQVLIANSMGKVMNPGAGPKETVLDDREKLAYAALLKAVEGTTVPEAEMAALYTRFGLDPAKFGVVDPVAVLAKAIADKKAATAGKPGAGAAAPTPSPQARQPIGMIVPPRTGAQARGEPSRTPESDAEFLARIMGGVRQ